MKAPKSEGGPTVIVSGMVAGTPGQGGAAWAVLQYLLGLRRLGCDVYLVEPVDGYRPDRDSIQYAAETLEEAGLPDRWALVAKEGGEVAGLSRDRLRALARQRQPPGS